jgi:UPF0176 protein
MTNNFVIAAFYSFFDFPEFETIQAPLLKYMKSLDICGSVLISPEGINSTIAGSRRNLDEFVNHLKSQVIKGTMCEYKESYTDKKPFSKSKVRLKQETISIGEPVSLKNVGTYLDADQWNELLEDPETIVIDTRNEYEINLGTFENAINPKIRKFKQLPEFVKNELSNAKDKKIATFCTGGIRCEKFTSWLVENGFHNAYHLKGGILQYLKDTPQANSKWHGECYVFDERVAVDHNLNASTIAYQCRDCNRTTTDESEMIGELCINCMS